MSAFRPTLPPKKDYIEKTLGSYSKIETEENGTQFQVVSYVGTNAYGASNPCSLTFDFAPDLIQAIAQRDTRKGYEANIATWWAASGLIFTDNLKTSYTQHTSMQWGGTDNPMCYIKKSADGKTISWYNTSSYIYQFNQSNYKFYFVGIKF